MTGLVRFHSKVLEKKKKKQTCIDARSKTKLTKKLERLEGLDFTIIILPSNKKKFSYTVDK